MIKEENCDVPGNIRIEHTDFRKLVIEPDSVDLIFCDPPYQIKEIKVWEDLGEFAAKVLKPNHLLITHVGQFMMPRFINALEKKLTYIWIGFVTFNAPYPSCPVFKIQNHSCPLLFFSKKKYKPRGWIKDSIANLEREKEYHPYQKCVEEAKSFIESITIPTELVCDPFMGSGTTGVAAVQLKRRFIGCDIDPTAIKVARKRISEAIKSDETLKTVQVGV